MPSDCIVRCVPIKSVTKIEGTELWLLEIMGWQVVTKSEEAPQVGELRVYIQPDSVIPQELAEEMEVVKYLKKGNVVRQVRLQGHMSFGIAAHNRWGFKIGEEVSERLSITKYVPPMVASGDQEQDDPRFPNYCNIENFRNFPEEFQEGEEVYIFEKIEGTNSKVGGVLISDEAIGEDTLGVMPVGHTNSMRLMIGTHNTRRKLINSLWTTPSLYQLPYESTKVKEALQSLMQDRGAQSVVFYGEIFGHKVPNGAPSMRYGRGNQEWRLFDVTIDLDYIDVEEMLALAAVYNLPTVPVLYHGPFSADIMKQYANMNTVLMDKNPHISEGIVIKPAKERRYDDNNRRLVLKYKSEAYEVLKSKGKAE
jgi:RNA ligase (TIGR02306 family)